MNLHEFRKIFYFLQYQFYIRSVRANRKGIFAMLPRGSVGRFLHRLAEDPEDEHYRWEPRDLIPRTVGRKYGAVGISIRERNRLKKQVLDDPGGAPHPSQLSRGAVIYRARKRSIRCRFMLFEFPKGFRKDQILSLFRSIIIHDLVKIYGCKTWDISRSIVDKNMSELVDNRGKTLWELFSGRCFENEPILRLLDNEHIETEDCPLETIKSLFFQKLFTNITDTSKSTRKDALGTDKHEHLRKIDQEVLRYLRRAKLMTELASAGKFSSFPSHLK